MSQQLPYFASGLALVLLAGVISLRAERPADLSPQCPPARALEPAQKLQTEPQAKAPKVDPAGPSNAGGRPFDRMPDGSPVPPLPADAPKRIKLGVALFRFAGAEGATLRERSRETALIAAQAAGQAAQEGFRRAIAKGDPGSNEDIGWIQRGVLERRVEHLIFQLKAGDVGPEPIETPRGFWVVRRIK
jgi:hypothetical protein